MSNILLALAAGSAAVVAWPSRAAPLEAYGRLPAIERVVISPDGAHLALAVTDGEDRRIVIEDIASRKILATLNAGKQKVRAIDWAGPNNLIVTASATNFNGAFVQVRGEYATAVVFDLAKHMQRPLLASFGAGTLNLVQGSPSVRQIKGAPFAFVQGAVFVENRARLALFETDLDHAATTVASRGLEHTTDYLVDAAGEPLAETDWDPRSSQWSFRLWTGHWEEVTTKAAPIERPELLGLGRDGASPLVAFFEDGRAVLRELSVTPRTRAWGEALPVTDPASEVWDNVSHRLIGLEAWTDDRPAYTFFDPNDQKVWKALAAAYPGDRVTLQSFSDDRRKFVLRVDSPADGPAWALVDLDTRKGSWIGNEYQGLKSADIGAVRPIAFRARDGLPLTGYLTTPPGKSDARKAPLVVLPHGGLEARDRGGFDWWAQALASRGYAVLQVNYRGSAGFGWDFLSAGFGQWGRKMQTDLSDGVAYLAGEGAIDRARACIVGGSYGGYAALAGATLDAGPYRCAASIAGPSDLARMVAPQALAGRPNVTAQRYWTRYMGDYKTLPEISPATLAAKVTIPVLLVHGKDDTVVPYEQSRIMADALRKAGKPVDLVTLPGEDHWLSRGETRLLMLRSVVAFLEKNNPP